MNDFPGITKRLETAEKLEIISCYHFHSQFPESGNKNEICFRQVKDMSLSQHEHEVLAKELEDAIRPILDRWANRLRTEARDLLNKNLGEKK